MTVSTTATSQTFAGGQGTLTFTFQTSVSNPNYIQVNLVAVSGGTVTPLAYNSGYTVAVNSTGVGGTVTISPTYSTAYNYVVYRQTALTQASTYTDYNQFPASTLMANLDQLTMICQELSTYGGVITTSGSSIGILTTTPAATLDVNGDIIGGGGVWADYSGSSTIANIASFNTEYILTKKIGKTVFVNFNLGGTSSGSTFISFTVPYTSANTVGTVGSMNTYAPVMIFTNGSWAQGYIWLAGGSSTVKVYATLAGGNFTNGATQIQGEFWYQSA